MTDQFDYAELITGELVCAMWRTRHQLALTGYVIYVPAAGGMFGPLRSFCGRDYEKIYWQKEKTAHDRYLVRRRLPILNDPIGGLMVLLHPEIVKNVSSCRGAIGEAGNSGGEDIAAALSFLDTNASGVGVTGSSLLDGRMPGRDLDVILYDADSAILTARRIRDMLRSRPDARLAGHWGRPWHHRRFRLNGVEVCPKIPLPQYLIDELPVPTNVQWLNTIARVVGTRFAHCLPAVYDLELLGAPHGRVRLLSADSSHSMAFSNGEIVRLGGVRLWTAGTAQFAAIPMGDSRSLQPVEGEVEFGSEARLAG